MRILIRCVALLLPLCGLAQQSVSQMERRAFEKKMRFNSKDTLENFDVIYQRLDVKLQPEKRFISGTSTIEFKALKPLNSITLDLAQELEVSKVLLNKKSIRFLRNKNKLIPILNKEVKAGALETIEVVYKGVPPTKSESFSLAKHNEKPVLWTLSEPFGAKDWFACKDVLHDKIDSLDVFITTPSIYTAVANGLEQSQKNIDGGMKITHFKHRYPIPAYLVAVAVSDYKIYTQQAGNGNKTFPIVNYLYPETFEKSVEQVSVTPKIMDLFENLFGTYPFYKEKYGHVQSEIGGGMEHTTVSLMGNFSRGLIAHELAHHWFGDKVTCATWNNIWLNEGFAEYLSGLTVEHLDGKYAFVNWRNNKIESITSLPSGNLYLNDEQAKDASRIFDGRITYNKGSMVVHMLRYVLGDEIFFAAIKNYLNDSKLAYATAVTSDLQKHLESVSGKNLNSFFKQWVYGSGFPVYTAKAKPTKSNKINLSIQQTTSDAGISFFDMPLEVLIVGKNDEKQTVVIHPKEKNQNFEIDFPFSSVEKIVIDPNQNIIALKKPVELEQVN